MISLKEMTGDSLLINLAAPNRNKDIQLDAARHKATE
jgi:hypothetical protein